MANGTTVYDAPKWVARYRWPETFRFKHLLKFQPFGLYGNVYCRISARRYVPCEVDFSGKVHLKDRPVRCIDSINVPVRVGDLYSYGK